MENNGLTVVIAQINCMVGDIQGNSDKVILATQKAKKELNAELVIFPELTLTGYPPEDLLLRPSIQTRIEAAILHLQERLPDDVYVLIGYPRRQQLRLFNAAGVIHHGRLIAEYHKQELPNFQVFDEKRYFEPGDQACVVEIKGILAAITICEDIWHPATTAQAKAAGAQLMLNLNASPFHRNKSSERLALLKARAREGAMPIIYANLVGGQDELIFDGESMVVAVDGELLHRAPAFAEGLYPVRVSRQGGSVTADPGPIAEPLSDDASIYQALVLGVKDYVNKNGFRGAVLGLSGGIDSAVTLAVAVDALGADRVEAIMMPFTYTSQMSLEDAEHEANVLGVRYTVKPIEAMYNAFMETLADEFEGLARDTTEENLQARCRGVLLMAVSNKKGFIVLTTGNKSEMAVGYSTLYGDMAGGFDVLKDVPKVDVFRIARYRNSLSPDNPPIPERVITRPPSAELSPDQKDEDSLPPYDILDRILELYVERDYSANRIISEGFDADTVKRIIRLVDLNEYKRRQAPVGARITSRGFGRDRRYPITCKWPAGD